MTEKSISEFLSDEYKEFAMYSIEGRAMPSVIDGFKPTQRKVIHISNQIWKTGGEKTLKVFQLAGKVASDAFYHHGNTSLENSIVTMAQKFKNNAALLEEDARALVSDAEAKRAEAYRLNPDLEPRKGPGRPKKITVS